MVERNVPEISYEGRLEIFKGQQVVHHNHRASFMRTLSYEHPRRVFSFDSPVESEGYTQEYNFVGGDGRVHNLLLSTDTHKEMDQIDRKISQTLTHRNIEKIDGSVQVDRQTGDVYYIYKTALEAWREDVENRLEHADEVHIVEYVDAKSGKAMVDFGLDKDHYVTMLDKYALFDVTHDFREYDLKRLESSKIKTEFPLSQQVRGR